MDVKLILNIFIVIFLIIFFYYIATTGEMSYVKSNIDGHFYTVRKDSGDKVEAADMLARINSRVLILLQKLKEELYNDSEKKEEVQILISKYNPRKLMEKPVDSKYPAFSINKGQKIYICVRDNNTGKVSKDINTVMYVMIHELAHVMTKSIGHTEQFWENNNFLLKKAKKFKLYSENNNKKYCGIHINKN